MNLSIESERLILKIPDICDTGRILRFVTDNAGHFAPFEYSYPGNYFTAGFQEMMVSAVRQQYLKLQGFRYYVYEKENTDRIVGCVGLANVRPGEDKSAELYYKLDMRYTGQGYAAEACRALISEAAETLALHRMECDILPENKASLRLAERLGFEYEGTARLSHCVQGVWRDHLRYSLIIDKEGLKS